MLSLKLNSAFFFFALVLRSCALHVPTVHDAQAIFQPSSSSSSQDVLYGAADGVEKYPIKIYKPPRGTLRKFVIGNEGEREGIMRVASEYNLDIWHHTSTEVHIYTPEDEPIPSELRFFEHNQMKISSPSPSASSKSGAPVNWNLASFTNSTFHDMYHPLFEIDEFILQLQELFPEKVRVREIGHSAEGREMRAISVSSTPIEELGGEEEEDNEWDIVEVEDASEDSKDLKKDKKEKSKKDKKKNKKKGKKGKGRKNPPPAEKSKLGFVIVGAQHAREWIATATALHFAHALTSNTSELHSMGGLLDVYDFHIIPVPNPDGYDYTWEYDRFWYKNRQIISPKAKCIGIDMNRNWGYKWKPDGDGNGMLQPTLNVSLTADVNDATDTDAVGGASVKPKPADPCSHWYPGLRAFEAPEANNIANFVNTLPDVVAFVDLRSYGQMLSSPYSYSCKRMPKDAEDQIEAALGATQALKKAYGTAFKTGSVCQMLYRAPGNIVDWMYARAGIKYSYVAHLRDTGTYGFSLPEKWIRPVGEETGNMVGYITEFIAKHIGRQT